MSDKHAPTSHARGRKKRRWKRDPHDWYIEEEWINDRLFACESFDGRIHDPACGIGRIVKAARRAGHKATGSDIVKRAPGFRVGNFFEHSRSVPNIVSNVPFRFALAFVAHAVNLAERKAALLVPAGWLNGEWRSRWFGKMPLARVWHIVPRPSMPPGAVVVAGTQKIGNGTTDYVYLIFEHGYSGEPLVGWLRRGDVGSAAPMVVRS